MGRYIEREQARQVICGWCEYDSCLADDYYWNRCDAKRRLDDIPSADVKPVVRGEWIWTETGDEDYEQFWVCSNCGEHDFYEANYCPNCGARMDEDG